MLLDLSWFIIIRLAIQLQAALTLAQRVKWLT